MASALRSFVSLCANMCLCLDTDVCVDLIRDDLLLPSYYHIISDVTHEPLCI